MGMVYMHLKDVMKGMGLDVDINNIFCFFMTFPIILVDLSYANSEKKLFFRYFLLEL